MRLLNAKTYEIGYFMAESDIPPYAILSHTWEGEEVTLQDLQNPAVDNRGMGGWFKIEKCCSQARADGYEWAWIDSCCIDKTSSAELSEAINSMFRWYEKADICYAFLVDVPSVSAGTASSMMSSRWFRRGWTLQELIAPARVEFYDQNWRELGTKLSLAKELSETNIIPIDVLLGKLNPLACLSGERLSWSAGRSTSRVEDGAYCLLGLFDINMPLLYGEGHKAWHRLQEQIIKSTGDLSLLLWSAEPDAEIAELGGLSAFLSSCPHFFRPLRYRIMGDRTDVVFEAEWSQISIYSLEDESRATHSVAFVRSGFKVDLRNINSVTMLKHDNDQLLWTGYVVYSKEDPKRVNGILCIQANSLTSPHVPLFRTARQLWLVPVHPSSLMDSCHRETFYLAVTMPVDRPYSERNLLRHVHFEWDDGATMIELIYPTNSEHQWELDIVEKEGSAQPIVRPYPDFFRIWIPNREIGYRSAFAAADLCLWIRLLSGGTDMMLTLSVYLDMENAVCGLKHWDETEDHSTNSDPRRTLRQGKTDRDELHIPGTDLIVKAAVKLKRTSVHYQITLHSKLSVPGQLTERISQLPIAEC